MIENVKTLFWGGNKRLKVTIYKESNSLQTLLLPFKVSVYTMLSSDVSVWHKGSSNNILEGVV